MMWKHLGRKILYIEYLNVHSSKENQVFAVLQWLLRELISILEINVFPLFLISFPELFNIICSSFVLVCNIIIQY